VELNLDGHLIDRLPDEASLSGMNENLAAIADVDDVGEKFHGYENREDYANILFESDEHRKKFLERYPECDPDKFDPDVSRKEWLQRRTDCELAVCRVEIPECEWEGTGFLVGPDIAFTCYHVMESVIKDWRKPKKGEKYKQVVLRFDYNEAPDDTPREERKYCLDTDDWLIDYRRNSKPDDLKPDELDYALLRVDRNPGRQLVDSPMGKRERGWLTPEKHTFEEGRPLLIYQHPKGELLTFGPGCVTDFDEDLYRVFYNASTDRGSSGSPCFTQDWKLVALHQNEGDGHNIGIMFSAILDQPKVKAALAKVKAERRT
jgi:hypothetical protein